MSARRNVDMSAPTAHPSTIRVLDLITPHAVTTVPHASAGRVREILREHGFHALPVVGPDDEVLGIVSTADLLADVSDGTPVSRIMTRDVYTIPAYQAVHVAAKMMRNHRIHHLVVTNEKKIVGILSSLDLLELVEEHRFVAKHRATPGRRVGSRKRHES